MIAGTLLLNFATSDKEIGQSAERLYSAADPVFARATGVQPDPTILQGNRFKALLNGDHTLPTMLV